MTMGGVGYVFGEGARMLIGEVMRERASDERKDGNMFLKTDCSTAGSFLKAETYLGSGRNSIWHRSYYCIC